MDNIYQLVYALVAIIPSIFLILAQARGRKMDSTKTLSETYSLLAKDLREEIDRLSKKIDVMEKEKEEEETEFKNIISNLQTILKAYVKIEGDLRNGVIVLRNQIIKHKEIPEYELPPELDFSIVKGDGD